MKEYYYDNNANRDGIHRPSHSLCLGVLHSISPWSNYAIINTCDIKINILKALAANLMLEYLPGGSLCG